MSNKPFARTLVKGSKVSVRFVDDIHPGKVVMATRTRALVRLLKTKALEDGSVVVNERSFDGEALLTFRPDEQVVLEDGTTVQGVWRQSYASKGSWDGIVYRGVEAALASNNTTCTCTTNA